MARGGLSASSASSSLSLVGVLSLLLCAGCPQPPAPPAPTVATLQPARVGVTLDRQGASGRSGRPEPVSRERRLESGTRVDTPAGVRASLYLDTGAWVLLDGGAAVAVELGQLTVLSGRAWIDARGGDPLKVQVQGAGTTLSLTAQGAALAVSSAPAKADVYCAAGQAAWTAAGTGGRLESGISLLAEGGKARETAQALWDDWTVGLAEPGPMRPLMPAGVGQLSGRRQDGAEVGAARTPLIVRRHEVRVRIDGDYAQTEVEQTFFNPRSDVLDGVYTVRLPEPAILQEFAVGDEDSGVMPAAVVGRARPGEAAVQGAAAQLEWAGPGHYRGSVQNLLPGKTRVIRLRYAEWLPHAGAVGAGRRSYVYPMGQSSAAALGEVPNLGEFSLEIDVSAAGAGGLEAGMGAAIEGGKVLLRRSDFRPRADFVLDLLDPKQVAPELVAYRGAAGPDGARYLLLQPVPEPAAAPPRLDLVLVVDTSAGADEAHLDLARATVQAVLRQLSPSDRVAVLAASTAARALGKEAFAPATPERTEELLSALGRLTPGGATDLGAALQRAVSLLPPGQGTVVYLGDGKPTVGALLPGDLRERLQRLSPLPRLYAVVIGNGADAELLGALCQAGGAGAGLVPGGGQVVRVDDRPEAARAALYLLQRAAQPALTGVRFSLGEQADVVYPEGAVTLEGGAPLQIVARLRPDRRGGPSRLTLTGLRDGAAFRQELPLKIRDLDDRGDLGRRWAQARLLRLLQRGAGREAAMDIGLRFRLVTPWTALVLGGSAGSGYALLSGDEERGTFVPPALRDTAPTDAGLVLEEGVSTTSARPMGLEQMYQRALQDPSRQAQARVCYERKSAGHPELSGRLTLSAKVALDGVLGSLVQLGSTLRDRDVEACVLRALSGVKLPPPPDGKIHPVTFALQFGQEGGDGPRGCSAASRAYLGVRRALWRERLSRSPGPHGAMQVWREAEGRCELRTWLDRRALLDLLRPHVGATAYQVDLYHRFEGDEHQTEVQEHLRREILRGLRTAQDVRAAQLGLQLDGGVDPALVEAELARAKTPAQQIAVLRQFLQLVPSALALKVRLLSLLEQAGGPAGKAEARRLSQALRLDPAADAAVRQAVGEFLFRDGDGAEGAQAFSEIVESAPFDPWGRRRLGDLYRAHGLHEAAYREYQVLGWLTPQDDSVLLLLGAAAFGAGRSDEALRLLARVAEAVGAPGPGAKAGAAARGPSAWARALYAVRAGQLLLDAEPRGDKNLVGALRARGRSDGLFGLGESLVAVTFAHPDAALQLYVQPPGPGTVPERATVQGGPVGIEAQPYERLGAGVWQLSVRRAAGARRVAGVRHTGEVFVVSAAGQPGEVLRRVRVTVPDDGEVRLRYTAGALSVE